MEDNSTADVSYEMHRKSDGIKMTEGMTKEEFLEQMKTAFTNTYRCGFEHGLRAFAWWKDGQEYLGTSATPLQEAIENMAELSTYWPPTIEEGPPTDG